MSLFFRASQLVTLGVNNVMNVYSYYYDQLNAWFKGTIEPKPYNEADPLELVLIHENKFDESLYPSKASLFFLSFLAPIAWVLCLSTQFFVSSLYAFSNVFSGSMRLFFTEEDVDFIKGSVGYEEHFTYLNPHQKLMGMPGYFLGGCLSILVGTSFRVSDYIKNSFLIIYQSIKAFYYLAFKDNLLAFNESKSSSNKVEPPFLRVLLNYNDESLLAFILLKLPMIIIGSVLGFFPFVFGIIYNAILSTTDNFLVLTGAFLNASLERNVIGGLDDDKRTSTFKTYGFAGYIYATLFILPLLSLLFIIRKVPEVISRMIGLILSPFLLVSNLMFCQSEPDYYDDTHKKIHNILNSLTDEGNLPVHASIHDKAQRSTRSLITKSFHLNKESPTETLLHAIEKSYSSKCRQTDNTSSQNSSEFLSKLNPNDTSKIKENIHAVVAEVKKIYASSFFFSPEESMAFQRDIEKTSVVVKTYLESEKESMPLTEEIYSPPFKPTFSALLSGSKLVKEEHDEYNKQYSI